MKTYILQFTIQSRKEFLDLPNDIQKRIKLKMEFFIKAQNPLKHAKKLQGSENLYRFRIGDYRIIVEPKDTMTFVILIILKVRYRKEVYE